MTLKKKKKACVCDEASLCDYDWLLESIYDLKVHSTVLNLPRVITKSINF